MDSGELKSLQAPLKQRYRDNPQSALVTSRVVGRLGVGITCEVDGWAGKTVAGLHPATGGDGSLACSADILLQALVACAGVTLKSVATHLGINVEGAVIRAEGVWDARGTLGVSREAPVGLTEVTMTFELPSAIGASDRSKLIELTERYCVIAQTLRNPPSVSIA